MVTRKKAIVRFSSTSEPSSSQPSSETDPLPSEADILASYEEQKQKSIIEFCKEDKRKLNITSSTYIYGPEDWDEELDTFQILRDVPPDIWEGGKKDFAIQLYENMEKVSKNKIVPIIERGVLKVLWRVECLRRQKDTFVRLPVSNILKNPTNDIFSVISNITIIGTFPTEDWVEDPVGEESMGFEHGNGVIGVYRIVDFNVTAADGSILELSTVINTGDTDRCTGLFGAIFLRYSSIKVATVIAYDDCLTRIEEVSSSLESFVPFAESDLDFPIVFRARSYCPGLCQTQFEKIMGMVVNTFMEYESDDFGLIPIHMDL